MAKSQFKSKRKVSGSRYIPLRKKRLSELGGDSAYTQIAKKRLKLKRVKGANQKISLLSDEYVMVSKEGKTSKLKIDSVENNPANVNYTRRNIITKGCIVKTNKGDVKITSRPGQNGVLQGIFI
jgi:small subunit ribosomal protein S8e